MGRYSRILRRLTSPSMAQIPIPAKLTAKANHQRQDKVGAFEATRRRDCSSVLTLPAAQNRPYPPWRRVSLPWVAVRASCAA
ncbi:hypothetical protein QWZ13_03325 [Reinekea marina]|uniref:hypothetical protein n=1 Tax=Reinekea marina TaxID=1310421 RepID=UPI0025B5E7F3|nr:hypothetical protein [Reinekea marina]MDN3647943.1 hypothetical protein [Reinekea marina]